MMLAANNVKNHVKQLLSKIKFIEKLKQKKNVRQMTKDIFKNGSKFRVKNCKIQLNAVYNVIDVLFSHFLSHRIHRTMK